MKFGKYFQRIIVFLLLSHLFLFSKYVYSSKNIKEEFYTYEALSKEINTLNSKFESIMRIEEIGKTYENRSIFVIKITGKILSSDINKPALMAIFAQHAYEHDVTYLAMGITKYLLENYDKDEKVTKLLNEKEVYIVPMMNPDGVEYDLSGKVKPFTWRKNRRPTGKNTYGVDLNRNWGYKWGIVPKELKKQYYNPKDEYYPGESPFSENETRAVRDFMLRHRNIKIFVDYHSGDAFFIQGGIGFPFGYSEEAEINPEHKKKYREIAQKFAELVTDPNDNRKGFVAVEPKDVKKVIKKYVPFYLKPFIGFFLPKSKVASGVSADWVYVELGIMAFGVEILRGKNFFKKLPENKRRLIKNQLRGFLFLLDTVCDDPFQ